jgi:tetratricopeptide (TPR) repeat protein
MRAVSTGQELDTRLLRFRTRPGSEDAARLATDLLNANRTSDALEIAAAGLRASPDDLDLLMVEGRAELSGGDLLKAQAALLKAARVGSTRKEPYRFLGEVLLKRGDPQRAAKVLERARGIDPADRAIQALHERAQRLAKIAETDHETAAQKSRASFVPPTPVADVEERTMVRPELSERLAAVTKEKAAQILDDGLDEDSATRVGPPPTAREARAMPAPRPMAPKIDPPKLDPPKLDPPPAIESSTTPGGFVAPVRAGEGPRQAPSRRPPPLPPREEPAPAIETPAPISGGTPSPFEAPSEEVETPVAFADSDEAPPPEPEPDEPLGEHAGEPEDPDAVLEMLRREGIFEPPTGEPATWSPRKDAKIERTTIGWVLGGVWVLAIGAAVGGWYGWQEYVRQRHAQAAALVDQARAEALAGDHEDLVDAERHLREARDLDPHATSNPTVLLFVHAQRALEDGAFEIGYLAPTVARAERTGGDPSYLHAASAIVAAGNSNAPLARTENDAALAGAPDDGVVLYLVGRLGQRLGDEHALEHLEAATQRDPQLAAAAIALAEARHDEGRHEDALALLDGVLGRDANNLRAKLWRSFLTADDDEIDPALAVLTALEPRLAHGAPTDHVLFDLTRSHLLRRQGHHDEAGAAVEQALSRGAQEPRLLALVAQAARAEGRYLQAEYAATEAVRGSPQNDDFRKLLAAIYLDRRNGSHALQVLTQLPADDPDVLVMSARAALMVGTDAALSTAAGAIDAYTEGHEDASVELRALRIRIACAGDGDPGPVLEQARALAHDNPGDPVPAFALGEAALRAHQAQQAREALETVVRTDPDDAEGHYLLARAYRMSGDAEQAETHFRRAIELSSELVDAKVALASLLLDTGDYAAADALYVEIGRLAGSSSGASLTLTGRLGRVESLIGLGRLDDADVQIESVRGADRDAAIAHLTSAHLAMAHRHYGDAVRELRPLSEAATPTVTVLAAFGDALAGAGEADAAGAAYDRALAIDADSPDALIGRATLFVDANAARDATPLLDRATTSLESRIRPPSMRARLITLRARLAMAAHDMGGARLLLEQATGLAGAPADSWFFYGQTLTAAHSTDAAAAYQHYLDADPNGAHVTEARRAMR